MRTTTTGRWRRVLALATVSALFLAACSGGDEEGAEGEGDGTEEGGIEGETVNILGALVDQDAESFEASLVPFEEETGVDVVYEGSGDFETLAVTRVEGGNPPDIMLFPQPGLLEDLQERDALTPLDYIENTDDYVPGLIDLATFNDTLYGIPYRLNVKSLVWYPEPEFSEAGYEVPETWSEMMDLTNQIQEDGTAPWCIGIESSGATGWVATDWIEDIMLRLHGPEVYDAWVAHDVLFDSPEVTTAIEEYFDPIWFGDGTVLGGTEAIVTTPFGDAPTPMFNEPPNCFLHRQASFIRGFFPEDVTPEDYGFFYLPPIEDGFDGSPVLSAGDIASQLTDTAAAQATMEFLNTPESGEAWAEAGGFISPFGTFDNSIYPDDDTRQQAEIVNDADVVRFDASDTMPSAVGTGAFWTEMVAYVNSGGENLQSVLQNVDAAWPASANGGSGDSSESEG